jgi:hypothetical protein
MAQNDTQEHDIEGRIAFAHKARDAACRTAAWLETAPTESEQANLVRTWHMALMTLTIDISESAVGAGGEGSTRAARLLNRSLFEYAIRAHHYTRKPSAAEKDGLAIANMARQIMSPAREIEGDMTPDQYKQFKTFMEQGDVDVPFPKIKKMLSSTLVNMRVPEPHHADYRRWMEMEYSLGSGIVHGSQAAVLDVFRKGNDGIERFERSPHFERHSELTRTAACVILCIAAVEQFNDRDFGAADLVAEMEDRFFASERKVTVWEHDALLPLLGIRR